MTKQELLTKLATECTTWGHAVRLGAAGCWSHSQRNLGGCPFTITYPDWLDERERLLNKPSWDNSSVESRYLAMDRDGWWFFYEDIPNQGENEWLFGNISDWGEEEAIAIPAGYDWRESLEERPVHSSKGGIDSQTKQSIMKRFLTVK